MTTIESVGVHPSSDGMTATKSDAERIVTFMLVAFQGVFSA